MFVFIIALIAGFITPYLDGPVARPIAKLLSPLFAVEESEHRLISFMVALLGTGLLTRVFYSGTPFWIAIGLVLGYFALRIVAGAKAMMDKRGS